MAHVITITGPSGAGKSTTLRYLLECEDDVFKPRMVPKYTTRPQHDDDSGEVICTDVIPDECDLVYEQYGKRYGLSLETIFQHLTNQQSPIVILNDIRAVEDVRNCWKGLVRSVFIFRHLSPEEYCQLAKSKGVTEQEEDYEMRYQKSQILYRIYIENIHLFDHVILNTETVDELRIQAREIVKGLKQGLNWPLC